MWRSRQVVHVLHAHQPADEGFSNVVKCWRSLSIEKAQEGGIHPRMSVEVIAQDVACRSVRDPLLQDVLVAHQAIHHPFEGETVEIAGQALSGRRCHLRQPGFGSLKVCRSTGQIALDLRRIDASTRGLTDEGGERLTEAKPSSIELQHRCLANRFFRMAWHVDE